LSAFVPPPELNFFLAGDEVRAAILRGPDGRASAQQLSLLHRSRTQLLGEVIKRRGRLWLRTDKEVSNTDWPLDAEEGPFSHGDWVIAHLDEQRAVSPQKLSPEEDRAVLQVIARHNLAWRFSADEEAEAARAAQRPHPSEGRRDLRGLPTVTIDAPSTRDIDDAVSLLPADADGALRLLVSIADPSEFIPENSALDRAARTRATSTYLPGRVLPMLPESLSNGWLSLLPQQDRAALTVELRIDAEGKIAAVDLYESLIRSTARLSYEEVAAFMTRGTLSPSMEPVKEMMRWLRTAAARLGAARAQRGGVVVSREEAKITFDPQTGAAESVESSISTVAHVAIERFMVAANEAVARWLFERGVPALYRVHELPAPERAADLAAAAHQFGYEAGFGEKLSPLALAAFDAQITGAPCEPALRSVLLRALGPARYTVQPIMHFGLAAPLYLHFTSPLRRYADLQVHRIIKRYLRGERAFVPRDPQVESLAGHINDRSRAASRAENDRYRQLAAGIMAKRIGETFSARITRVRPFGLLVQLDESRIEGSIGVESLPDGPYQPDARETALSSAERSFPIGAAVRVSLASADPLQGRIEFRLVEEEPPSA
jgi:ribonuclease R